MIYAKYTVWILLKDSEDDEMDDATAEALIDIRLNEATESIKELPRLLEYQFEETEVG